MDVPVYVHEYLHADTLRKHVNYKHNLTHCAHIYSPTGSSSLRSSSQNSGFHINIQIQPFLEALKKHLPWKHKEKKGNGWNEKWGQLLDDFFAISPSESKRADIENDLQIAVAATLPKTGHWSRVWKEPVGKASPKGPQLFPGTLEGGRKKKTNIGERCHFNWKEKHF